MPQIETLPDSDEVKSYLLQESVKRTLQDLVRPSTLIVMIAPVVVSFVLWTMSAIFLWDTFFSWSSFMFRKGLELLGYGVANHWLLLGLQWLWSVVISVTILILVLVLVSALVLVVIQSVFLMPLLSRWVNEVHYPQFVGARSTLSIWKRFQLVMVPVFRVLFFWLFFWPLVFLPVVNFMLGVLTNAYLIRKIYVSDSLSEIATAQEIREIAIRYRAELRFTSVLSGLGMTLPLSVFIAPIVLSFFYLHFCRLALLDLRG